MQFEFVPGHPKVTILLFPLFGFFTFILFYIIAAFEYPGGSWTFPNSEGFSVLNNYLCDLLDTYAINGNLNTARYFARISLGFLCVSIVLIWAYLPKLFGKKSLNLLIMQVTGVLSLVVTVFLAAGIHDIIVRIAGVFGTIALFTSFIEFYRAKLYKLLLLGIFCFIIFILNYFMYETSWKISLLPIIQKITFSSFLVWFIWLNIILIKYTKLRNIN